MSAIVIADDERYIRTLLKNIIDWDGLGLTLAGEAGDGLEAFQLVKEHRPRIVITDIRMPRMDGLELIRQVGELELDEEVYFIVISGHKEFNYAYEAIKYGAVDFLLKPINQEELNSTLERLIRKESSPQPPRESDSQIVRKQLLVNAYYGALAEEVLTLSAVNEKYRYAFAPGVFAIGMIQLDRYEELPDLKISLFGDIQQKVEQSLAPFCADMGQYDVKNRSVFLLNYGEERQKDLLDSLPALLMDIQRITRSYPFLKATIGLGAPGTLAALGHSLETAKRSLVSRSIVGTGRIIDYRQFQHVEQGQIVEDQELLRESDNAQELLDGPGMDAVCQKYLTFYIKENQHTPYQVVPLLAHKTRLMIMGTVRHHIPGSAGEYSNVLQAVSYDDCTTRDELLTRMRSYMTDVFQRVEETVESTDSKTITTVKKYIEDNMDRHVSLEEISQQVFLSPSYLGVLFKKETGELFSQYVTNFKMEKAKEMLREVDLTIKEVADRLGYRDTRSFRRQFQSTVGVKPSEYRKLYNIE